MQMTAAELIKGAVRLVGTLGNDITLTVRESLYPLEALNLLLESWSLESLFVNKVEKELFTLQAGRDPHTWGVGGDFDSARPTRLLSAKIRIPGGVDMDVPALGYDDYAAIRLKSLQNSIPQYIYLDGDYPLANLYIYPVPTAAYEMLFFSEKPLAEAATLNTELSFPPGYLRALKYSLALEIAQEYHVESAARIQINAQQAIAAIKRGNKRITTLEVDPALLSPRGTRYNIYRDQ